MNRLLPLAMAAAFAIGCGSDSGGIEAVEVSGAPPPLQALYDKGPVLLGGQVEAYREQLARLKGYPVVVNKWASWCPPCRAEFPYFASQAKRNGTKVAFLGVDSNDNEADAAEFLERYPVPYPSVKDPDQAVAREFRGTLAFPTTAFYDSKGELAYLKHGGYRKEEDLAEDIRRYAK